MLKSVPPTCLLDIENSAIKINEVNVDSIEIPVKPQLANRRIKQRRRQKIICLKSSSESRNFGNSKHGWQWIEEHFSSITQCIW